MEELLGILSEIRPDIDFAVEKQLITSSMLDSFDIISIVSELNDAFDVSINVNDLLPENFDSAEAMWDLIEKIKTA